MIVLESVHLGLNKNTFLNKNNNEKQDQINVFQENFVYAVVQFHQQVCSFQVL